MLRNGNQDHGSVEDIGSTNFNGRDYVVINATAPEDDGKDDGGEGVPKKKSGAQKKFEVAIQNGLTVLYEEVGETLDPGLDPVISKSVYVADGVKKVNFGGKGEGMLYDDNFRLLITTKLANPHYLPVTCIKLSVINFTVTFLGLEE